MEPQAQIVIILHKDGQVEVNAPLSNKVLCLGMIELAKDAVLRHKAPLVQPAEKFPIQLAEG